MTWDEEGFLISKNKYNENSLIAEIFTKNHGKIAVKLVNTKFYTAFGKSKKDAEQNAALLCLENIKKI